MQNKPTIEQAMRRIAELNQKLGLDPEQDLILQQYREGVKNEPLLGAAKDTIHCLKMIKEEVLQKRAQETRSNKGNQEYLEELKINPEKTELKMLLIGDLKNELEEYTSKQAVLNKHLEELERKIQGIKSDPSSFFLPLGTIVQFNGTKCTPNSLAILPLDGWKRYPRVGTIGVVTGLSHNSEYPIAVSIRRPFYDGYPEEGQFHPQYDRLMTYRCDRELIDVVAPGLLPNGEPCSSYGWIPTHKHLSYEGPDSILNNREHEMIIYADGFYWRLHDFGGTQSVECIQSYDRIEDMSWVGEPIEEYRVSTSPTP